MKSVTITVDDAGKFYVSQGGASADTDQDRAKLQPQPGGTPSDMDADKDQDVGASAPGTPVKDLQQALMLAGRMLSQPDQEQSPFDQGVAKTMAARQGM